MKVVFTFLLLVLSASSIGFAAVQQRINKSFLFQNFDSQHGLLNNQITHIIQDKKGYLWLSNWRGISQFDGKNFRNFRDTDGLLSSSTFEAIEYLPDQFLIQHNKGITLFSPEKSALKIPFPDTIIGLRIGKGVYQDSTFWIFNCFSRTSGKTCHLHYNGKWVNNSELTNDTIRHILRSKTENTNYLFTKRKIWKLANGKLHEIGKLKNRYTSYATDQYSVCWGFSPADSQFYTINYSNSGIKETPSGIFAKNLTSRNTPHTFVILPDQEGIVYYTDKNELFQTNKSGSQSFGKSFSLIREMIIDREKNLWVATEEGIFNFFRLDFERLKLTFTDKSDMIWSLASFGNSRIIAGKFGSGFIELMDSVWKPVEMNYAADPSSGMEPFSPYMGAITSNKSEAWFPVWKGLIKFDKTGKHQKFTLTTTPEQLYIDPKSPDTIFAAASKGMLVIDKNDRITFLGQESGFSGVQNESIIRDKYNRFWLGSSQGPTQIFDKNRVLPASETPELSNVICAQKDSNGNLWFGTDKGLVFYDYDKFVPVKPKLIHESVDILISYNDSLMIGIGYKKVILINYKRKNLEVTIHNEKTLLAMQNSHLIDSSGNVWFSTMYDIVRFNPLKLLRHESKNIPQPIISSIEYSSDNVNWIKTIGHNNLKVKETNLRFNFIALTYKHNELITYRSYLENFNNWGDASSTNHVSFTNLKPGNYRLAVQSSVDGQSWSRVTYSENIIIQAAWYQIVWVRISIVFLLFSALFILVYIFISSNNKRKIIRLTEQKKMNQLQLQLVNSKQIPHFSGNALANIEHFIFNSDVKQANKYLSLFSRFLNQTMQFADRPCLPLKQEVELARIYLELEVLRFENAFAYQITIDQDVNQNILIPNMLLHTWSENAVKHGLRHKTKDGMIHISATQQNNTLILSVEDNGIGRENARKMGTSGTGRGLTIISEQIEIFNKFNENQIQFNVNDLKDQYGEASGTRFTIYIPEKYNYDF